MLVSVESLVLRRGVCFLLDVACWQVVASTVSHGRLSLGAKVGNGREPTMGMHGQAEQDAAPVPGPCPACAGGCRHGPRS